jgi:two-component system, NtrC family, sensor kinase
MSPPPDSTSEDPEQIIADLRRERDEALARELALAEVLQVINSSRGDLAPVFEAMLDKALRLCEANLGHVLTYDGERFAAAATRGNPQFDEWLRGIGAFLPEAGSTNERIVRGESIIEIRDLTDDPASKPENPIRRALIEIGGFRTSLSVALRKEQSLLGVLHIHRQEVRRFSEKEIALLQTFAAQAVIAMENARLLGELRGRTRDLQESLEYQAATSDVLQIISRSTFDLQPVLDTLVKTAVQLCNADFGNLFRREGDVFRRAAVSGLPAETSGVVLEATRGSIVGRVVLEGGIVHVHDVAADPEYMRLIHVAGQRSVLGVPLLREGEPIGVFTLARRRVEPFTERQIELVAPVQCPTRRL